MHGKTELEAEELAKEEDKKKTNEHAAANEQEEVEVEHPDNAAVGDQEDHEPVEYEEPAAQQEVRQNMDLKQILTSVGLEEYYEQFETELITIETLKTTTALELREILKIPFWIGEIGCEQGERSVGERSRGCSNFGSNYNFAAWSLSNSIKR